MGMLSLSPLVQADGQYTTGHYTTASEEGCEIIDYDEVNQQLIVSNGEDNTIELIDLSDPTTPTLIKDIDMSVYGGGVNSVKTFKGIIVAAVEADTKQDNGKMVVFDSEGNYVVDIEVGALPDMVNWSSDAFYIVIANEGEPNAEYDNDPEGTITILDLTNIFVGPQVKTIDFSDWNGREKELLGKGIKLGPETSSVAQNLEPEYVAISADNTTAYVTMQENNAVAIIDLSTATIKDIVALGTKDWSKGLPVLKTATVKKVPRIGKTPAKQNIYLSGPSGLYLEKVKGNKVTFIAHGDRGPNASPTDVIAEIDGKERPFPVPDYQLSLFRVEYDTSKAKAKVKNRIKLYRRDANGKKVAITGRPNLQAYDQKMAYTDEVPVDLNGALLENDPYGGDIEGIVIDPTDGSYWICDEYRPALYHFTKKGELIDRFIPEGTATAAEQSEGYFGTEVFPAVYAQRRANRGFEGIAIEGDKIYAFVQSPLDVPDTADDSNSKASHNVRILEFDKNTHEVSAEYIYVLDSSTTDKLGDAVSLGDGKFAVIERDSSYLDPVGKKFIMEIDISHATNIHDLGDSLVGTSGTVELMSQEELADNDIVPVTKRKVLNLPSLGYLGGDKAEGLAYNPETGDFFVMSDTDFGIEAGLINQDGSVALRETPTPIVLGHIEFSQSNELDTTDKDDMIGNFRQANVLGLYQPDSIVSYDVDGVTYFVTANEGDAREYIVNEDEDDEYTAYSEEARVDDLNLDPSKYDAEVDQLETELGRMKVTTELGDTDGDGDVDIIHTYGGRSFSIWDSNGGLVYDSGDTLVKKLYEYNPELINDGRSDDKGVEPEALTLGTIGDKTYAFVGLERTDGVIMIFDITNPKAPVYVNILEDDRDTAPEGLVFVPAADSASGENLLVVASEKSGTVTVYTINDAVLNPAE